MKASEREKRIKQAKQLIATKEFAKAITILDTVISTNFKDTNARMLKMLAEAKGDYDALLQNINQQLAEDRDNQEVILWSIRGVFYADIKDYDKAILDYNKVIELDENNAIAYNNRGYVYHRLKEYDKAILDYNKVIELDENNAIAYNNRGYVYHRLKEYDKAILDYTKAIKLDENNTVYYTNRGSAHSDLKEYGKAILDYTKAIELDDNNTYTYVCRGYVYYDLKKYDKAILDYTKAIALDESNVNAYWGRGDVYFSQKEFEKAIYDYQKVKVLKDDKEYDVLFQSIIEKAEIELKEQLKNKKNQRRQLVNELVEDIKKELIYNEEKVCHFSSLQVLEKICDGSKLRFSHTNLVNDPTEGKTLFSLLKINDNKVSRTDLSVFVGSFVESLNHNKLPLWRAYGRDGTGVSFCLNTSVFKEKKLEDSKEKGKEITLYKVAYIDETSGNVLLDGEKNYLLRNKIQEIQDEIAGVNDQENQEMLEPLLEIQYLFKNAIYQEENEVRLFEERYHNSPSIHWDTNTNPPRTFIELPSDITKEIKSITIGPKVENAEGWIAFFRTKLASKKNNHVEITQSKIPYR